MEQIIVQIKDKHKARILFNILTSLDFVNIVRTGEYEDEKHHQDSSEGIIDFFSFAGLWANRDITLNSVRQKAWPGQHP